MGAIGRRIASWCGVFMWQTHTWTGEQAEAMAASLAEEQGRRQAATPLPEQPEAELRRRFARSLLLPHVGTLLRLAVVQHCSPADLQQQ